jgi:hypothetical protein
MPALVYDSFSIIESFDLEAALGEGISIYVYGASWSGQTWLSDPTAALLAVNDAFNTVPNLVYSSIQIMSSLSFMGTGMAFVVVNPVYENSAYLNPDQIPTLRANIAIALNAVSHLTYGDIVLGTSKAGT